MIHEYAIEPNVLCAWSESKRDYAEFLREYGLGTPRIFSSFPKLKPHKLRSYFLQSAPADESSQKGRRYIEMVNKLVETIVLREVEPVVSGDWGSHVRSENQRAPFNVIISSEFLEMDECITSETMYDLESRWLHSDQINIQRTDEGISRAVSSFLRLSTKQVVIIDTFGWTPEAIVQMQSLISRLIQNRVHSQLPEVKLFYKQHQKSPNAHHVKGKITDGVNLGAAALKLDVFELEEIPGNDVFHNRCVLTEHGGVITGHGIGVSGEEEHTDEATLMRPDIYQKKWRQFIDENCFQIVSEAGG
ncbi:hypothetical protein GNX18_10020 [Microbulbifer sp. SH-1]|uniref:hypothetical protein n=1 Tax=Microbulbifer sp. SH-1 TaxID=2681547 RepID=UPI001408C910|nr:hypothetical protein [Microbulbifer sp. SH-1]QIL90051.1 hypothetical protein GNX18_10020 [Microbulbifer sp. SH-1]